MADTHLLEEMKGICAVLDVTTTGAHVEKSYGRGGIPWDLCGRIGVDASSVAATRTSRGSRRGGRPKRRTGQVKEEIF